MNKILIGLCLLLTLVGCSKSEEDLAGNKEINSAEAVLEWDGGLYDFQETDLGVDKTRTMVLKNIGEGESKPVKLDWVNKNQTSWKIVPGKDLCTNKALSPGEVCSVTVMFSPVQEKEEGNLLMAINGSTETETSMEVKGRGVASLVSGSDEVLELNKNIILFGDVKLGKQSTKTFSVKNRGNSVLAGIGTSLVSNNFSVKHTTCKLKTLRTNQSCTIEIEFNPKTIGDHLGEIVVSGATTSQTILLKGQAELSDANLKLVPATYSPQVLWGVPEVQNFTISNNGSGPARKPEISFEVGANFQVLNNTCQKFLKVGENCSFSLKNLAQWGTPDKMTINGGRSSLVVDLISQMSLPVNTDLRPSAMDYQYELEEESSVVDIFRATDPQNQTLTYNVVSSPSKGTLVLDGAGFIYTANSNKVGADSFSYKVVNALGLESEVRTISLNILNKEDNPETQAYILNVNENESTSFNLNETYVFDPEGGYLFITRVSQPTNGVIRLNPNNTLTYTPTTDYEGSDSFIYYVSNGIGETQGTLNLTVNRVNEIPATQNLSITTDEDTPSLITLLGTDADLDPLTYTVVLGPMNGTLSGTAPNLTYTPNLNYNGSDSFTYRVNDGTVDSNISTVSITVNPINDAPIAQNLSFNTNEEVSIPTTLVGTDIEGDVLTYTVVSNPTNGVLSGTLPNLTYTPNLNYNGNDSFTYRVNDGSLNSNLATVAINVTSVNDVPVADAQTITTNEDTPVGITLTGSDADGDSLNFQIISGPSQGSLSGTIPNLIYTPNLNYNGADSFTYRANDGSSNSAVVSVSITVNPVNDRPVVLDQSISVQEDTPENFTVVASDVDGDTLSWELVSNPTNGVLSGTLPNLTYTPNLNYNGSDTFQVRVNDGTENSLTANINVSVGSENDLPVMTDQTLSLDEDTSLGIDISGTDADGDTLTYTVVSNPANGVLSGTIPNLIYTPNLNYNGSDSFQVKSNDGTGDSNTVTISLTVNPINDAPVAQNDSVSVLEDSSVGVNLSGSDVDGDPLTYTVVSNPTNGVLSGTAPNLTYTPNLNYNGVDSFTFKVNDGTVDSNVATVSITVSSDNDIPVADNKNITTDEDVAVGVVLSGTDSDGDSLTYSVVSGPTNGVLSGTIPNLIYTPNLNYNGSDSFTYQVNDGTVNSNLATVLITVNPVNDIPVADNKNITTNEDVAAAVVLSGSDVDGDPLTYTVVSNPTNGVLSGTVPNLTYTPNLNYNGSDSFTYRVNDGTTDSNLSTVSITVNPLNDTPVADNKSIITDEDVAVGVVLSGTDSDGDSLTYSVVSGPTNGVLSGTAPNLTYTPNSNYNGSDSFTYQVNDGTINSNVSTVSITVNPVNDAPVANSQSITTDEDTAVAATLVGTDIDGDTLTYTVVSGPTNGVLSGTAPNLTYTPNTNYNGVDSFTFKVNDGTVDSNLATVSITVDSVNDAPVAGNSGTPGTEDQPKNIGSFLPGLASDPDGDSLTWSITVPPSHGTLSGTLPNIIYTPDSNYTGSDEFRYKVNDGQLDSDTVFGGRITIFMSPVNDVPVWTTSTTINLTTEEDTQVQTTVNATDVESTVGYFVSTCPNGSCSITSGGVLTYTPDLGFVGNSTVSLSCSDGTVFCDDLTTVNITVESGSPAPRDNSLLITVDNTEVDSNLTDFPVMYNLQLLGDNFWNNVQSNGGDIAATSEDDSVRYSLELTNFDKSNRTGIVFIKMNLSSTVDTSFNLKYNDSATGSISLPSRSAAYGSESVWSNGYAGVWHLDENGGSAGDSTSNLNHFTPQGGIQFNQNSSKHLENSVEVNSDENGNDLYSKSDTGSSSLDLSTMTIEAWINIENHNNNMVILQKGDSSHGHNHSAYGLVVDDDLLEFNIYDGDGDDKKKSSTALNKDRWYYVSSTFSSSSNDVKLYINGNLDLDSSISSNPNINNNDLELGGVASRSDRGFSGLIDEVRLSSVVRSASWLKANYTMTNSPGLFFKKKNSSLVLSEEFSGSNSNNTPAAWYYLENSNENLSIESETLKIDGEDNSVEPMIGQSFTGYSTGKIEFSFDFFGYNNGSEQTYEVKMQLGEDSLTTGGSGAHTEGIGVNLKWASDNRGMTNNSGFGYDVSPGTTELLVLNGEWVNVRVEVDIDNQQYKVIVKGVESSWVSFEDPNTTTIDKVRFFADNVSGNNVQLNVDNVVIRRLP